jgi:hypothetical protein
MEEKPPYKPNAMTFPSPQEFVQAKPLLQSPLVTILTPWSLQLIAYARQIQSAGQNPFAIVLGHAACEWATEDATARLLRRQGLADDIVEEIIGAFPTTSLTNRNLRGLFTKLTGSEPQKEKWWEPWLASRKVRHAIAHRGSTATPDAAVLALSITETCVRYIAGAVEKAIAT